MVVFERDKPKARLKHEIGCSAAAMCFSGERDGRGEREAREGGLRCELGGVGVERALCLQEGGAGGGGLGGEEVAERGEAHLLHGGVVVEEELSDECGRAGSAEGLHGGGDEGRVGDG
eukprot:2183381-Pleurochrysis_carterae.AAC.2